MKRTSRSILRRCCLVNPVSSQRGAFSERRSVLPAGMRVAHRNNGKERYGRRHCQDNRICNPTSHARQITIHAREQELRLHNFRSRFESTTRLTHQRPSLSQCGATPMGISSGWFTANHMTTRTSKQKTKTSRVRDMRQPSTPPAARFEGSTRRTHQRPAAAAPAPAPGPRVREGFPGL